MVTNYIWQRLTMLNFRKLRQDFAPSMLKDGRNLHDDKAVQSAKILILTPDTLRISCRVTGTYENTYQCEVEVDRTDSTLMDSDCDCPYHCDCQHLAAVLFYLERHIDEILVDYSKGSNLEKDDELDEKEKEKILKTLKEAETKETQRKDVKHQKELLEEYITSSQFLGKSPFFLAEEERTCDKAELTILFSHNEEQQHLTEVQLALRLPYRSKPLNVLNIREFLESIRYQEQIVMSGKRYFFTLDSFGKESRELLRMVLDFARFFDAKDERQQRVACLSVEAFGSLLATAYELALEQPHVRGTLSTEEGECLPMPCLFCGSIEEPLRFTTSPATLKVSLEYLQSPASKILLNPTVLLDHQTDVMLEDVTIFESSKPGLIHQNTYYRFSNEIKRKHLRNLLTMRDITVPEPLFGTFVENSLTELMHYAKIGNRNVIDNFVTLPFVGELGAECELSYLNGELEAVLHFVYDDLKVPAAPVKVELENITPFVSDEGILARNLTEEQKIIDALFQDFSYDPTQGIFAAKTDKKIVEFMTEIIPKYQERVTFHCPENLKDQFIYDATTFKLHLKETSRIDLYEAQLTVNGNLKGLGISQLWDCISSKKTFVELTKPKPSTKKKGKDQGSSSAKILVLDLDKLAPVIQIFDEMGLKEIKDHSHSCPLWSLASIDNESFKDLPVTFSISTKLKNIQKQMLGKKAVKTNDVPKAVQATLRGYQKEGVEWLDKLRIMHLNGILADDMGLGKTLQAIIAITQKKLDKPKAQALIVCPTSLIYNWKEEFHKFNPELTTLVVDGTPTQRKKLLGTLKGYDVIITSYSLLQKDVEQYQKVPFEYCILDEAQHIKNRGTRNAKSVKLVQAAHRLILTGTPIENSLDELWSLFDFLMPGLLSSYDRFVEKYMRGTPADGKRDLEPLRRKVSPFILRRMKKDVLSDLPPVTENTYHCHLTATQRELYQSYAESARKELSQLVKKEGFERVQIHVLATLTRLKQICCHPAIFAKEDSEEGDSAKYDMLMELLQTLIGGGHKSVIFSQYTRMLHILREDLKKQGVPFSYLDGSTKNRLEIVNEFNSNEEIPIFLVSLKAGGSGLNLTGADTVIHYDMWWNPAVQSQATDRVHRIGQKSAVSSYKLVTLNTIEEKIVDLQKRKQGLVKKIVSSDEEAISKLTWEEVLELLQT